MQKYEECQSPVDCQTFHPACDVNYISNKLKYLITNEIYKKLDVIPSNNFRITNTSVD